ncbi:uncharacterized protein [Periplaneta americana]|uniref:uncharacterized protein isoform X2 n=1 Tax=Periplaneta americana TaxID=6978 RepID=UPI0037E7EAAC
MRCWKWLRFCGLEDQYRVAADATHRLRICMDHFTESDYYSSSQRVILKQTAVPTVHANELVVPSNPKIRSPPSSPVMPRATLSPGSTPTFRHHQTLRTYARRAKIDSAAAEGTCSLIGLQAATEQAAGLAAMPQTIPAPMSTASKITASTAYAGMNKDACQQGNSMIGEQLSIHGSNGVIEKTTNHNHEKLSEKVLHRQKISNFVKRKAIEDMCTKPTKLIHRELSAGDIETIDKSDIKLIRRNIRNARTSVQPHLPKMLEVCHNIRKRKLKLSDGTSTQAARNEEDEDENPVVTVAHASDPSPTMSPDAEEDPLAVTGMQLQTEVSAVDLATVAGDQHPSVTEDSDVLIEYFGDPTHDHLDEPAAQLFMDPDTKSIAETLLHLRAEKLLHEMDRLKLHREKMEAEKRNIKLRTEILALRKQLSVKHQICQLSSQPSRSSESDSVAASGEDPVSGVPVHDEQVIILQKPLDSVQLTPDIKGSAGMSRVTLNLHKDKPLKSGKRVTVKLLEPSGIIQQGQCVELSETSNKSVGHIIAQNCGVPLQGGDIEGLDRHIVPVKRKVTLLQGRTSVGKCNTLSSETRNVQEHPETCKNLSWYENSSQILNSHSDSGAENRNVRRSVGDDISESANENSLNAQFNPNECDTSPRSVLDTGQDICMSKRIKTEYYRYSESEPS